MPEFEPRRSQKAVIEAVRPIWPAGAPGQEILRNFAGWQRRCIPG
jgi:hypothetical protein